MRAGMSRPDAVVVVGGGTMGRDVAAIFLHAGWQVQVIEPVAAAQERLPQAVAASAEEIGAGAQPGGLSVHAGLDTIQWDEVRLVIECAPEKLEIKQQLFQALDRAAPAHLPLASNSSGLPITRISETSSNRSRMLGLHFFMPAHLVPAVEVIRGEHTDEAIAREVSEIMRMVGRKPVQVRRDIPGFLANRIQHALMREAIALVDEGFASAEDVDIAVRYGFGFRYVAAGPLLQKDLAGIDIHCAAAASIYPHLNNDTEPARVMRELVASGDYGVKAPNRKGFYEWDEASIEREQARYRAALAKAMQILRDEEA